MVKNAKVYECDICGREETVEEGYEPNDIVHFEIYDLKPCICKRCLKLAMQAYGLELGPLSVTDFADKCKECGAKYGKLLKQKEE